MPQVTGILLAAGLSRRFGSNKLLHPLANGIPLVIHATRRLQKVLPRCLVVVNAQDHATSELLESESVQVVFNNDTERGMGTSIACGVRASLHSHGWVIALADMPYLNASTIRSVAAGIRDRNSICAPLYGNQRGHPVGFGSAYAEELIDLSGNEGARRIIAANRDCLELFATQDSGAIADIDYPQDINTVCNYSPP
jgi:molybdenum cofactor cytidylyltransferase